ncbi:leucine rich repeat LRR-containing protein [Nitzschia inconspicua]|uniref:Leucine rich repeat LRR-containing protein n=1 Tax=Nitzschia inconspicua TaxID=303405 RepID=A0A9K3KE30_9STRA|nr:leucine rich repeat LRR-containing protein [Nitzschia inconspicua]
MTKIILLSIVWSAFSISITFAAATKRLYQKYQNLCHDQPTIKARHEKGLQWLFKNIGETQITSRTSPQHEAACWMFRQSSAWNPQRYVMAVIYYATKGGSRWEFSDNWMVASKHECTWYGVKCNLMRQVVELDLGYIEADGLVPREIGLLKNLKDIDLHGNELQGVIPLKIMVGNTKLEYLRLHMNGLFGAIHKEIKNMKGLKELYLFGNYIAGTIPKELASLKQLEIVDLYANQLTGTIPSELAKIPNLKYLDVHDNNLVGTMPKEICAKKLDALIADCHGKKPEVKCDCCTVCCEGMPNMICVDQKTGKRVDRPI